MGERLRCAVVGAGAAGLELIHGFMHCPRAAVVAISEKNVQRAREISERYKIPRNYLDYNDLIAQPDIDAVAVALPPVNQAKVVMDALKARKHVLVERPFTTTSKEAIKVYETARAMKRVLMVSQELRFHRSVQIGKMIISRGDLGDIYHIKAFWMRRRHIPHIGSWHTQKQMAGGGCLTDLGQSLLDAIFFLLGEFNPASVSAQTFARFGPRGLGEQEFGRVEMSSNTLFDVEDFATAFIRMRSGKILELSTCWAGHLSPDAKEMGIEFLGTNAGLSLFPAKLYRPSPNGYDCSLLNIAKLPQPEDKTHHFVQCVLENKKPLVTLEESLSVQQVIEAIYSSASHSKEVTVAEPKTLG